MKTLERIKALALKAAARARDTGAWPAPVNDVTLALALDELEARIEARLATKVDRLAVSSDRERFTAKLKECLVLAEKQELAHVPGSTGRLLIAGRVEAYAGLLRLIDRGEL